MYAVSTDQEHYNGSFGSIEEAIAESLSLGVFWVGECTPPTQPEHYFDASDWLETVSCQDEYCGDYAEGWDIATKEQRRELDEEVQKVMAAWLDRHDLRPKFFVVHDPIKYIVVDGVAEPEPVKETP
jgi:hypothetical protein